VHFARVHHPDVRVPARWRVIKTHEKLLNEILARFPSLNERISHCLPAIIVSAILRDRDRDFQDTRWALEKTRWTTYVDTTVVVRGEHDASKRHRDKSIGARFIARGYPEKTKLKRHVVQASTACHRLSF